MARTTRFEHGTCGRCCGTGYFGPTCVQGGICFGCGGTGWKLTKRGAAAAQAVIRAQQIAVENLAVGDVLMVSAMVAVNVFADVKARVTALDVDPDGKVVVHVEYLSPRLRRGGCTGMIMHTSLGCTERVLRSPEQTERLVEAALAYQATLTKTGTVRKVRRPAPKRSSPGAAAEVG